jgi:hypothetical protein
MFTISSGLSPSNIINLPYFPSLILTSKNNKGAYSKTGGANVNYYNCKPN